MNTYLIYLLLAIYVGIAGVAIYDGNWNRLEYWTGCTLITHAILKGL
jgi:hypothetical protein